MTDSELPEGHDDLSAAPEYKQLGEEGNPFSDEAGESDQKPDAPVDHESAENPPLPDWGTDGTHGVDGADKDA